MKLPDIHEVVFSLKAYAGAMLALYIAYSIGLPRPFWAMTTAYIVSQPWSGAVRSKAFYRLGGTFIGSAFTVYLVPRLANYPVLMILAMVLWIGICLYVAVLDRTPRSYLFMLAGYTAAMIGFPSVTDPLTIFDTALARVEEISLGIVCATLVHSVVLPRGIAPTLLAQLDSAIKDARHWMRDTLTRSNAQQRDKDRRVLANDITQLRLLATHVPFDTSNIRWTAAALRAMQTHITALTPLISAVEDRLRALQAHQQVLPESLLQVLQDMVQWIEAGAQATPAQSSALKAAIAQMNPSLDDSLTWPDALLLSLSTRLLELVETYEKCMSLRSDIQAGLQGAPLAKPIAREAKARYLHQDPGLALLSALSAAIAVGICCVFWIATAWTNGATAAMMAAIFSCFFAAQDNPVPGIMLFLTYTIYSIPLSALYLLGIMPAIHSFEILALAIFPVAFVLGVLMTRPVVGGKAMALFFGFSGTLALHDTGTADLVSFIDITSAQILGVVTAAVIAAVFRKVSADWSARRIQAANWKELAALASAGREPAARYAYIARMLDRIGLLQPRLALTNDHNDFLANDALRDLRIGKDIAELQRARPGLGIANSPVQTVLQAMAYFFTARSTWRGLRTPPQFLAEVDRAILRVAATPAANPARQQALVALVGIRSGMFPEAPDQLLGQPTNHPNAS